MMDFKYLEFIASCSIFVGIHWVKTIATKCLAATLVR